MTTNNVHSDYFAGLDGLNVSIDRANKSDGQENEEVSDTAYLLFLNSYIGCLFLDFSTNGQAKTR